VVSSCAAGPVLLRSETFRNALLEKVDAKVAWSEMEAFGFMEAAHEHDVSAIVITGISDLTAKRRMRPRRRRARRWRHDAPIADDA
jgi:nucleoside phosphorylase